MRQFYSLPVLNSPVLVTGCAGFIGFHITRQLLEQGLEVVGLDNLNDYYDISLKQARVDILSAYDQFQFIKLDLREREAVIKLFREGNFEYIVHLAAQAGISYSLINPHVYIESNIVAFLNLLEGVRGSPVKHLVFASSSSIYGLNERMPYRPQDNVDHPISLYAASKKADELMAHAYAYLYGIPVTGLRFFTAYGPWDRPDMAVFRFCRAIFEGEAIKLFNYGKMSRDFTYVDDIVDGILRVLLKAPAPNRQWTGLEPDPASSPAGYRIYNIGAGRPLELQKLVGLIEKSLGKKAAVEFEPLRKFDMESTCADISDFKRDTGYQPQVMAEEGVPRMVEWFLDYYGKGRPWPKVKG